MVSPSTVTTMSVRVRRIAAFERARLAAVRQAQPDERRRAVADHALGAERRCGEAVAFAEQGPRSIGRAVVGDDDLVRTVALCQQCGDRRWQHGGFVVRGDDHRQAAACALAFGQRDRPEQTPRLPADEDLEHRVVGDVGQAHRPREDAALAEGEDEERHPGHEHQAVDDGTARRCRWRGEARRGKSQGRRERIDQGRTQVKGDPTHDERRWTRMDTRRNA